jgi:hypothetical protein
LVGQHEAALAWIGAQKQPRAAKLIPTSASSDSRRYSFDVIPAKKCVTKSARL